MTRRVCDCYKGAKQQPVIIRAIGFESELANERVEETVQLIVDFAFSTRAESPEFEVSPGWNRYDIGTAGVLSDKLGLQRAGAGGLLTSNPHL